MALHGPNAQRPPTPSLPLKQTTLGEVIEGVIEQIAEERAGNLTDRNALKVVVQMFTELGELPKQISNGPSQLVSIYSDLFMPGVLDASKRHYKRLQQKYLGGTSPLTVAPYMHRVSLCLNDEKERCRQYLVYTPLQSDSDKKLDALTSDMYKGLQQVICDEMLDSASLEPLFESPIWSKLYEEGRLAADEKNSTHDAISVIWQMSFLANRHDILINSVQKYIERTGSDIQKNVQEVPVEGKKPNMTLLALKWVTAVLDLRLTCDKLTTLCFDNDKALRDAINSGFVNFLALEKRAAEWLSLYIDDYLKKGSKGQSDDEMENVMDLIILVFRSLSEKDVFENYYKQHLAKRLLANRSVSDDLEKAMVSKLKVKSFYIDDGARM